MNLKSYFVKVIMEKSAGNKIWATHIAQSKLTVATFAKFFIPRALRWLRLISFYISRMVLRMFIKCLLKVGWHLSSLKKQSNGDQWLFVYRIRQDRSATDYSR